MLSLEMVKGEQVMELRQRVYDIDDVWQISHHTDNENKRYELIDGALIEMSPPGGEHGEFSLNLGSCIRAFVREHDLGRATVETGYHPPGNRLTLLAPDVAFVSHMKAPAPFPKRYVPVMPDLAVEILSPTDMLQKTREKAEIYLRNGAKLVWIVLPEQESVEVCRQTEEGKIRRDVFGPNDTLTGEDVLPGFTLEVRCIFH